MKILLIDKNLVDPVNHEKWNLLAIKEGITIRAITPSQWIENFKVISFSSNEESIFPIVPLPVRWPGRENRSFYLRGLGREIRSFAPDIILCFEEPSSLFAAQVSFLRKLFASEAALVFYTWDNLAKGWKFGYRPRFFYAMIQKFVITQTNLLLAANEEGKSFFQGSYSIPVKKLYFGVSFRVENHQEDFAPSRLVHLSADLFIVGYVGRLLEMKGVDTLLNAIALLDDKIRLVILGSGPAEGGLRNIVKELKLGERVTFIPGVPSFEARAIMKKLNVLVLPSRTTKKWKEQYGRVLIESMALGVAVIGSDSGAIPEIIGDCGLIFHEGDAASLAKSIERIVSDQSLRDALSKKGLLRSQEFSAEKFADALYCLLLEL